MKIEMVKGSVFIRCSDDLLYPPFKIQGDIHNFDHFTSFKLGLWRAERWMIAYSHDTGERLLDSAGNPIWLKTDDQEIKGGWPGSEILILAECRHTFTLLEGPGRYLCIYGHKEPLGNFVSIKDGGWTKTKAEYEGQVRSVEQFRGWTGASV